MRPDASKHNPNPLYLRVLIERAGISQRRAAELIGMSWTGFRNYLREPGDKLYRVADYRVQFALECLALDDGESASYGRCPLCGEIAAHTHEGNTHATQRDGGEVSFDRGVPHPPAGPGDALLRAAPKESRRQIALYLNRLYGISDQFTGDELVELRKAAGNWLWTYARGACDFGAITQAEYRDLVEAIMVQLEPFDPPADPEDE